MTADDELLKAGNRNFSVAMIALESGDFAKSEKLLRETVDMMGKNHPVAMLAMKTLGGIASEQGRYDDCLEVSLDLLDAQIRTFGVNHSETSRTVRGILKICKDHGKPEVANEISMMVDAASNMEKVTTTQSLQRLRRNDTEDNGIKKSAPKKKQETSIVKRMPIIKYGWMGAAVLFISVLIAFVFTLINNH